MSGEQPEPQPELEDLRKENRLLARKLQRLESNVRQLEDIQGSTSKLLSKLTQELEEERAKSETLLLNILPQEIIKRLEAGETVIADRLDSVTVLFSDFVGFTETSSQLEPHALVSQLNMLFSEFDALCERTGVEKLKTIGDAYMAVGGLPGTRPDHTAAVADLAIEMMHSLERINEAMDRQWRIRIGLHCGPAVAGIIGMRKFVYDVWGDTVNVASRLETSSAPNRIHVSEPVAMALREEYELEPRGTVELKGKGQLRSFFLVGRRRRART